MSTPASGKQSWPVSLSRKLKQMSCLGNSTMEASGIRCQLKSNRRQGGVFSIFYFIVIAITTPITTFFFILFLVNYVLSLAGK